METIKIEGPFGGTLFEIKILKNDTGLTTMFISNNGDGEIISIVMDKKEKESLLKALRA